MTKTITQAVITNTSRSPHARLKPVSIAAVELRDNFWAPRRRINHEKTLPSQFQHCEETGRLDNFRRAAGKKDIPFEGIFFNDSDIYKWLEAAAWTLAGNDAAGDAALLEMVETAVTEIEDAQEPDGYLDTYFTFEKKGERFTNLRDLHELYCAGHFIQGAVAHHRATGDERLLDVAKRLADCIGNVFGPADEGKKEMTDGHEEIEMALVELARDTGEEKYQKLAQFFIDVRGRGTIGGSNYHQDHEPLRDMKRITGHAVRAVYLNCGAADLVAETGDAALRAALDHLWDNMTQTQMYVSGGLGSRYEGEAFGKDYELPNERAYTETCAAIGSVMWNWRMLALEGDARYADVLEHTLYNAVLPGLSLDGQAYFYQNPLFDDGTHRRQAWFGCACCPPNVARLLAQLPGYFYSTSDEGIWVHLYAEGGATLSLSGGGSLALKQTTNYPWDGDVTIEVESVEGEGEHSLFLRVPGWCEGASIAVNGEAQGDPASGTYVEVRRAWRAGDSIHIHFPMPVRKVECHPYVAENRGRVALLRGPILFCLESADHPGVDLRDVSLSGAAELEARFHDDLLGGVMVLHGRGKVAPPGAGWQGRLYRTHPVADAPIEREIEITAVPYYAWANRDAGRMQVWVSNQ